MASMKYFYPQVSGGYRWNMLQRIKNEVGIEPTSSGDTGGQTVLEFSRELTTQEITNLDTLMANNPTLPPSGTLRFKVGDIWEKLAQFNAATGMTFQVYYSESVPGSGVIDTIELHSSQTLNNAQKNKTMSEYAKLISGV